MMLEMATGGREGGQKGEDSKKWNLLSMTIFLLCSSWVILFLSKKGPPQRIFVCKYLTTYPSNSKETLSLQQVNFALPIISKNDWPSARVGKVSVESRGLIGIFNLRHSSSLIQSPSHLESRDNWATRSLT